jgi:hypothetical protein
MPAQRLIAQRNEAAGEASDDANEMAASRRAMSRGQNRMKIAIKAG